MLPLMEPAAMERKNLTDRFIDSRKAAPPGERLEYPDAIVPGLYLRVTDRGHKSYALVARYPLNPKHPTRRALGDVGAISLADVREKAREWLQLIGKGIDPKVEEDRQRAAQLRRQANSFAAVAAEFLERHASKLAKKDEAETIFENEFTKRWANRPVTDVTTLEVATAIRAIVARGSPYQAHNAFGHLRKFFNWAIATGEYGIEASPVERLRPSELIGKREARARTLNDDELRWVWEAAGQLGYPYGPLVRILILTGQRKSQVAEMPRSEIDQRKRLWTIPAQRMKRDAAHLVPLAPDAAALLESLPAWTEGDFVFTTTGGKQPVKRPDGFVHRRHPFCGVHERQGSPALAGSELARGARSRLRRPKPILCDDTFRRTEHHPHAERQSRDRRSLLPSAPRHDGWWKAALDDRFAPLS
jgi:integrase